LVIDVDAEYMTMLKKQYECPHFRILVIGRANAGKTTILEKVCGVAQGTKPIIYDKHGIELKTNIGPKHGPEPEPEPPLPLSAGQLFDRGLSPSSTYSMSSGHSKSSPAASVTHLTPSIEVSKFCSVWISIHINVRGVYMILSTRSPTLEATLYSMTLKVLNLVQARRWKLFGNLLRSGPLQLKQRIHCM
jgi:hypothetical protein